MIRLQSPKGLFRLCHHMARQNGIVIAAAVRTPAPTANPNPLLNIKEEKLTGLIINELIKRTSLPRDEFKKLIMCASSQCSSELEGMAKELGLKSCQTFNLQRDVCSSGGIRMALQSLHNGDPQCIITGDSRCQGLKLPPEGLLASELMSEIMPVVRRNKGDDEENEVPAPVEAAALAWTTYQTAERLNLQPLAMVRDFVIEENGVQAIYNLNGSNTITAEDVYNWQMVRIDEKDIYPGHIPSFEIPADVLAQLEPHQLGIHDAKQTTASHLLTHLVHSLPTGHFGCLIIDGLYGSHMLLMLQKLAPDLSTDQTLPKLTLYTKEPCPLCDDLLAQLEDKFAGQFELEKVFIDKKENVRYLRLFRHDIPVLFFNGQFLCMHRLNEDALTERLAAFRDDREASQMD